MAQIVIQFSTSTAWQSKLIRRLCHGPFSHVDLVLPDGNLLGASDQGPGSPCLVGDACGVAIRPPHYQQFYIRRNAVLEADAGIVEAVIGAALSQVGKPFDSAALEPATFFTDEITRDWSLPTMWFCAELTAWYLVEGRFWPKRPLFMFNRFAPMDIIHRFDFDPRFINRDQFLERVPGLELDPGEQ